MKDKQYRSRKERKMESNSENFHTSALARRISRSSYGVRELDLCWIVFTAWFAASWTTGSCDGKVRHPDSWSPNLHEFEYHQINTSCRLKKNAFHNWYIWHNHMATTIKNLGSTVNRFQSPADHCFWLLARIRTLKNENITTDALFICIVPQVGICNFSFSIV